MSVEYYKDQYGRTRKRTRNSTQASQDNIRDASYDTWGNLVSGRRAESRAVPKLDSKGKIVGSGVEYEGDPVKGQQPPVTGIDRFKAVNNIPTKAPTQMQATSSGMSWGDAVKSAKATDTLRTTNDTDRMAKYRKFKASQAKVQNKGIDTTSARDVQDFTAAGEENPPRKKIRSAPYEGSY